MTPEALLSVWLRTRLAPEAMQWLTAKAERLPDRSRDAELHMAFGLVPRRTGKTALALTDAELAAAEAARPGWRPDRLAVDEAARLYLLLALHDPGERFEPLLAQLCATADVAELIVLYRGLPLYPDPERYRLRAAEGIRTNMRDVFEAVAHDNPYPAEQLPEDAWNQLVLKALFVGSPLDPIQGLDRRANPVLARMLVDYAHERRAAGRPVSPELWRCVGPFAADAVLVDLARILDEGSVPERHGAALALACSPDPAAAALLQARPAIAAAVGSGAVTWQSLSAV
jgi:hypothetical protein